VQTAIIGGTLAALIWLSYTRRSLTAWLVLLSTPLACAFAGAVASGKAYSVRYALGGLFGLLGLASVALQGLRPGTRRVIVFGLFTLFLWADGQWYWLDRYHKEDSRAAVAWLRAALPDDSRVDVVPAYAAEVLSFYAQREGGRLQFVGLPDSASQADGRARALVGTRLHHVPNWTQLRRSYLGGRHGKTVELIGYHIVEIP
jgi:hypothetical protein